MEADHRYTLENSLIRSHEHFRLSKLNASFKATGDLMFDGLPREYSNLLMTRMQGSQYLMGTYAVSYRVDIDNLKAEILDLGISHMNNCFIDGEYMLAVRVGKPVIILRDLREIGLVDVVGKFKSCKNYQPIFGRLSQQTGKTVYAVDYDGDLYRIEWQDIKEGKYHKTLVKTKIQHFFADKRLGLATVHTDGILPLASGTELDLRQNVDPKAIWTIVTCIAKCWIVSGDLDGQAIMASITNKGDIRSTLRLKLTSNGYEDHNEMAYGGIYALKNAYARHRRGIILAIERDGCCHLISVEDGLMSKLQTIDSIVPQDLVDYERNRVVLSVTATDKAGEFIAGGYHWTKKITIKLK